ncbi:MAG: dTDP-glucose 4,6-dehydratase [Candidatus Binatia bacterium]|nr:MAG: dTDP-glucose 4,6-dehydratase [Candidatus Binatia bacterium]
MLERTILVCGGAGFIGTNFVRLLLGREVGRVVVLDKLTYAASEGNVPQDPRLVFYRGDIADGALVRRLLEQYRPRWVVNLAAETHVDRSIDCPDPFVHTNVLGTFRLLECVRAFWAELPRQAREEFRFLQVSTDEVYGTIPEGESASEMTPYRPRSPYAASKAAGDHFALAYHHTYGLPVLLTNSSNNFGPYQYPEKLIPLMVLNALDARELPIYGDGGNVRDWLYVTDHCEALLGVLERGVPGTQYNIGAGNQRTNLEVVEAICRVLEQVVPARENARMLARGLEAYAELKRFVEDRPGHDRRYALDASRVTTELGWAPRHEFMVALEATVQWYVEHRDWCEAVLAGRYDRQRLGLGLRISRE